MPIVPIGLSSFPPLKSAKLANEFALLARDDVRAAKILYRQRLYALSAFHCQQTVEKATKAVGLLTGGLDPTSEHLLYGVGHDSVKGVLISLPEFVESQVRQWETAMAQVKNSPGAQAFVDAVPFFKTMMEKTQATADKAKDLTVLRSQLNALPRSLKTRRRELWRSVMGFDPNPGLDSVFVSLKQQATDAGNNLKAMKLLKPLLLSLSLSDRETLLYVTYVHATAVKMAVNLAFVTMWHEEATRYPPVRESDYWFFGAYSKDNKLVKISPELNRWATVYCEATLQGGRAVLSHYSRFPSTGS